MNYEQKTQQDEENYDSEKVLLKRLNEDILALQDIVAEIKKENASIVKKNKDLSKYINQVDPDNVRKYITKSNKRLLDLSKRVELHIFKEAVITEVFNFTRENPSQMAICLISLAKYYEMDDNWWGKKQNLKLSQWVELLMNDSLDI